MELNSAAFGRIRVSRVGAELARRRDEGESFPMPLMLVSAREDPMVAREIGTKLHALISDAGFGVIPEVSLHARGHPREVLPLLADFLTAEDRGGG